MSHSDNWGNDLSEQVPVAWRAQYIKWRGRIQACDSNDELIAIAGFLEVHTRIGLDTASRMEIAARASLAGQKATLLFSRYLRIALRGARRMAFFNLWFYAFLLVILISTTGLLDVECQTTRQIDQIRKDADQERREWSHQNDEQRLAEIAALGNNAQILRRLMDAGVGLKYQDYVYSDGSKGFLVGSKSAVDASFTTDPQNRPVGILYFRYTQTSNAAGSAPQ